MILFQLENQDNEIFKIVFISDNSTHSRTDVKPLVSKDTKSKSQQMGIISKKLQEAQFIAKV